jgi:Ca2+-binding RTX toxin-like protein
MPALNQPYEPLEKEGLLVAYLVKGGVRIWRGALVCVDSSGYLVPASDTANLRFVGVAFESVDNSGGANGAKKCRVIKRGTFVYNRVGSFSQSDLGAVVRAVSDNEVAKTTTNNIAVGTVVELPSNSTVRIRIDNHTV